MSYYRANPAISSIDARKFPKIKPGTSPIGTPHATFPPAPVVPQGGHGPPSGGVGKELNPPKTKGGTPSPITTPVHHVPTTTNKTSSVPHSHSKMPLGMIPPGHSRVPGMPPGSGRDRGSVPHPMSMNMSDTNRFHKDMKPQRGEGHEAHLMRDRIGMRNRDEDNNCNRGLSFGSHFEFRMCDRDHRFLGLGRGDRIEDAIEDARNRSRFFGNIWDFDRGIFLPPQQFFNSVPIVQFQQPFGLGGFPQFLQPQPQPQFFPQQQPFPQQLPTTLPPDTAMSMGMSPDMAATMMPDMGGMSAPMDTGSGTSLDSIKQTLMQNGITPTMLIVGVGIVALLLVIKK